jgi:predicted dienelactone hydrolase
VILRTALLLLWAASASAAVTTADAVLTDTARQREIPIKAYIPDGAGPFPVIVFSHGAGGSKDGYAYLGQAWAEHGYAVLLPTHVGSDSSLLKKGRPLYNLGQIRKMLQEPQNFVERPTDISYVVAHLGELEAAIPALKGKLDGAHVGVGGHSFGAYTAMALAGAKIAMNGQAHFFIEPRPLAFLAMSPQGPGAAGFEPGSWSEVTRPVFVMTGTQDKGLDGSPWTRRREAYEGLPEGHKLLAVLNGGTHMDFADRVIGHHADAAHAIIVPLSLAWWDATLKGQPQALEAYEKALPADLRGKVTLTTR